jgi:DNA (cytosine-5)-methyltransferase 1
MKHLDCFSGLGGFALAAHWAGIETIGFCEIDPFCQKVLAKNFPGLPIHNDIHTLNGEDYVGIELITGGYPCQPFSVAGKQRAYEDPRHLWPELRRVIAQAKPTWVVCENVPGHVRLGLDSVLHDLEDLGYSSQPFIIPSLATGANHNRNRVYIVAYSAGDGCNGSKVTGSNGKTDVNDKKREDNHISLERRGCVWPKVEWESYPVRARSIEPPALRVDDELPDRMDRNRAIGNAIDPLIAYEIFTAIVKQRGNRND